MLQRQHLFSVYIHPLPDYGTFPEESIFWGREIQDRIQVHSRSYSSTMTVMKKLHEGSGRFSYRSSC